MSLGNYWFAMLAGLFGSIWFFILCFAISKFAKFLIPLGQNSLLIIGTHYIFVTILSKVSKALSFRYTTLYSIVAIVYTIVILCLYMLICLFVNKYLPWLVGRPCKKKENKQ